MKWVSHQSSLKWGGYRHLFYNITQFGLLKHLWKRRSMKFGNKNIDVLTLELLYSKLQELRKVAFQRMRHCLKSYAVLSSFMIYKCTEIKLYQLKSLLHQALFMSDPVLSLQHSLLLLEDGTVAVK